MARKTYWDITAAISLVAIVWLVYFKIVNAWWMNDDPQQLASVISHGILPHLYTPNVELGLVPANFTPWLSTSYGIDFLLFGLEPKWAYIHHLISISFAVVTVFFAVRLFLKPFPSYVTVLGFLVTYSFSVVAQLLATRHYLEGLVFSAAALLLFAKALERDNIVYSLLGAAFYIFAVSSKEIYTPLVVLLVLLLIYSPQFSHSVSLARRIKYLIPYIGVIVFYIFWRAHMLGVDRLLSGYASTYKKTGLLDLAEFPGVFLQVQGWTNPLTLILFSFALAPFIAYLFADQARKESLRRVVLAIAILLLVLLPIFPVIPIARYNPNYFFLVGFIIWLAIGTGINWCIITCSRCNAFLATLVAMSFLVVTFLSTFNNYLWKNDAAVIKRYRTEGEFVLYESLLGDLVVSPLGEKWYYVGLNRIRETYLGTTPGADSCKGPCECLERTADNLRFLVYENGAMQEKSKQWLANRCHNEGVL